jgi:hypothetical protein
LVHAVDNFLEVSATAESVLNRVLSEERLLAKFGDVESTGTSTRGKGGLSLINGAVFPAFL